MSKYGIALLAICFFDLSGTVLGMKLFPGLVLEANPTLNSALEMWGWSGFVLTKMFLVLCPIALLEYSLRQTPAFKSSAVAAYKFTIWAYILILFGSCLYQVLS